MFPEEGTTLHYGHVRRSPDGFSLTNQREIQTWELTMIWGPINSPSQLGPYQAQRIPLKCDIPTLNRTIDLSCNRS